MPHRLTFLLLAAATAAAALADEPKPDAPLTPGGRGGPIVRVTTLEPRGPGSLDEALRVQGPRLVVFEVGGVIDLAGKSLQITEPFVTVAGQTAPAPGITLIRGGLGLATHDVIVQHLMVRPGEAGRAKKSGWEVDGIATNGAHHVLIDHCSCTWATDENLSASGPRFDGGPNPDDWRAHTSHHVTFAHCLIAEGLCNSTHSKGEHSKGSLLHDNARAITVRNNLYASNRDRNPLAKGGVQATIVNNWIFNPRGYAVSHALVPSEWTGHAPQTSELTIVGNVFEHGPSTSSTAALFENKGGPVKVLLHDNLTRTRNGQPTPQLTGEPAESVTLAPDALARLGQILPAAEVKDAVAQSAGARPWDRDPIDQRIIDDALANRGALIDSESAVGGYPKYKPTHAPFVADQWNLDTLERR
jgi:pectate lyase